MNNIKYLCFFLLVLAINACTSRKKYMEVKTENNLYRERIERLKTDSSQLAQKLDSLHRKLHNVNLALKNTAAREKTKKISRSRAAEEHYKQISSFLYNIIKYVEWSSTVQGDVFTIAIVGNDPMFKEISGQFNGKRLGNRLIHVKSITSNSDICHADVYFVSHQKLSLLSSVYKATKNEKALVVSDHHQLISGVHVTFFLEGDSLKFDLNEEEIKKSNIVMSSTLKNFQN